jgi:diguanylate cyclase (GGDEF)-like protein
VLPGLDLDACQRIGERIRAAVAAARLPHRGRGEDGVVTVSIGAAAVSPRTAANPGDLITRADAALYRAKQAGRNAIWAAPITSDE